MAKTLQEILNDLGLTATVQEGLGAYKHIELTQDEIDEAMLLAKIKKEKLLKQAEIKRIEEENRRNIGNGSWRYGITHQYMINRAASIFKKKFVLDEYNTKTFELLCLYFSNDPLFITESASTINPNPSLEKGILLSSPFGHGKTWLMGLFSANARQVYKIYSAKKIANDYENYKDEGIEQYMEPFKNAINDANAFYQTHTGLCIDDFGAEGVKQNYGNKRNVIADIIEHRYNTKKFGTLLHITTNFVAEEIYNAYTGRVASRIREMFNILQLPGNDRRI